MNSNPRREPLYVSLLGSTVKLWQSHGGAPMQSSFRLSLAALVLTCAVQFSASQTVARTNPKEVTASALSRHFVCNAGYSTQQCHEQVSALRPLLDRYGAGRSATGPGFWSSWMTGRRSSVSTGWTPTVGRLRFSTGGRSSSRKRWLALSQQGGWS